MNYGAEARRKSRTVRAVFKVPKGAKKVAITLGGVGTFDDVDLAVAGPDLRRRLLPRAPVDPGPSGFRAGRRLSATRPADPRGMLTQADGRPAASGAASSRTIPWASQTG